MSHRAHRRQFIIDQCERKIREDWRVVTIGHDLILSHCPDLSVEAIATDDGEPAILIGDALGFKRSNKPVSTKELVAASYDWTDRWVLIAGGKIHGDCAGLLGIFIAWRSENDVVISSSLALISRLFPHRKHHVRILGWYGMGWHAPPSTRLEGTIKLLPDMAFDCKKSAIFRHEKAGSGQFSNLSADQIADLVTESIAATLAELSNKYERLVIPLTAGYDSRTFLAIALAHDIPVETMTFLHPRFPLADSVLPQKIAHYAGVKHRFVPYQSRVNPEYTAQYATHTFNNIFDADRTWFIRDMFHWAEKDVSVVRTTGLGICRAYYHTKLAGITWEQTVEQPDLVVRRFHDWGSRVVETAELKRWITWKQGAPFVMDWQDTMFRDQRMCGWLSTGEQSVDMLDSRFIQIANGARLYDLLTALPAEERLVTNLQERIFRKTNPRLQKIPFNPPLDGQLRTALVTLERERHRIPTELHNIWRYKSQNWHEDWGRDPLSGV